MTLGTTHFLCLHARRGCSVTLAITAAREQEAAYSAEYVLLHSTRYTKKSKVLAKEHDDVDALEELGKWRDYAREREMKDGRRVSD